MIRSLTVLAMLLAVVSLTSATPITLNFTNCTAGVCNTESAPYLLTGGNSTTNDADFRYHVPNWSSIESDIWYLNSVTITYDVYDNGDTANEGGKGNLNVNSSYGDATFGWTTSCHTCNLNGYTAGSPDTISVLINDSSQLGGILDWLQDNSGHFQYDVHATSGAGNPSGTFYLAGAPSISLDYTAVPEPATFALIGASLFGISALRKRICK